MRVTVPLLELPECVIRRYGERDTHLKVARQAMASDCAPTEISLAGIEHGSIKIDPVSQRRIAKIADDANVTFQHAFAWLTKSGIERAVEGDLAALNRSVAVGLPPFQKQKPNDKQLEFWRNISGALRDKKICIAEASTGIGKGRVLVAAAIEQARAGSSRVVICAPTLVTLGNLWREFEYLRDEEGICGGISAGYFPGVTEFADRGKLLEWLNDPSDDQKDPAVCRWIEDGGPVLRETALTRALRHGCGGGWRRTCLLA